MEELRIGSFVVRKDDPQSYGQLVHIQEDTVNPGYIVNHGQTERIYNKEDLMIHDKGVEAYKFHKSTGKRYYMDEDKDKTYAQRRWK